MPAETSVFRVSYMFRPSKTANPQEKVVFVVADTDVKATGYVNSLPGNEVTGASTHVSKALIAGPIGVAAPVVPPKPPVPPAPKPPAPPVKP